MICCRGRAEEALATMRDIMTKLKLTVNETKTRVCKLPEEKFDFLGYTFGRCYSPKTGRAYLGTVPSDPDVHYGRDTLLPFLHCRSSRRNSLLLISVRANLTSFRRSTLGGHFYRGEKGTLSSRRNTNSHFVAGREAALFAGLVWIAQKPIDEK